MASKAVKNEGASGGYTEVRLRGKSMTVGDDLVLVRTGQPKKQSNKATLAADRATVLVSKVAVAMKKPGIHKSAVFRGANSAKVFAYSVDPSDPTKVIRESADGTRRAGRLGADGKFKVADKAA